MISMFKSEGNSKVFGMRSRGGTYRALLGHDIMTKKLLKDFPDDPGSGLMGNIFLSLWDQNFLITLISSVSQTGCCETFV